MSGLTIEEAWADLNPKPGVHYRDGRATSDAQKARALAYAAVREALGGDYAKLIARIGRLGRAPAQEE